MSTDSTPPERSRISRTFFSCMSRARRLRLSASLIIVAIFLLLLNSFGCRRDRMYLTLPNSGQVKTTAYFYVPSGNLLHEADVRKEELRERVCRTFENIEKTTRKMEKLDGKPLELYSELQASSRKILEYYNKELRLMELSTNWSYVLVFRVLLENDAPSRFLVFLRPRDKPLDIALVLSTPGRLDEMEAYDLVQSALDLFERFTVQDWKKIKPSSQPAFDAQGQLAPLELQKVFDGSVFIGPPN